MNNNPGYNPCPQCDSGVSKIVIVLHRGRWRIRCTACGTQTAWHPSAQLAFDNWQIGQFAAAVSQTTQPPDTGGPDRSA